MIRWYYFLILGCLLVAEPTLVLDQAGTIPRQKHSWGRYQPGAWKQVRVKTETLDERGQVTSTCVTETLTTLESVTDSDYTLRIEVMMDVGGKQFNAQPQVAKQGFNGECDGQKVVVRRIGVGALNVGGRNVPCEMREVVVEGGDCKRTTFVHYSDNVSPYVLKRETTATDPQGRVIAFQSNVEVVKLDVPHRVLSEVKKTTHLKTVYKQPKACVETIEVHCDDVPGGVVAHTSREDDEKGRTLRRSTLELVDYGKTAPENDSGRRRGFHRNRVRKTS